MGCGDGRSWGISGDGVGATEVGVSIGGIDTVTGPGVGSWEVELDTVRGSNTTGASGSGGVPTMTGGGVGGGSGLLMRMIIPGSIGGGSVGMGGGGMIVGVGVIVPAVPLIDESPIIKGVVIPPPWRIVTAPSLALFTPALQMLIPTGQPPPLVSTRTRPPASIVIAPLVLPGFLPKERIELVTILL